MSDDSGFLVPPEVARELIASAMQTAIIPGTRPPALDLWPWHQKLAFRVVKWWDKWRNRAAYRAFRIIAGYDVPDWEE